VKCRVDSPSRFTVGERVTVTAIITNTSKETIETVDVKLDALYVLDLQQTQQRLEYIKLNESRDVSWSVTVVAPLLSGSLHVSVATTNGGGVFTHHPFTAIGATTKIDAYPGLYLKTRTS
jgi:hypothetical protein